MTSKQTEIATAMMNGYTLSLHKRTGRFSLLTSYRSGSPVHTGSANAMVLRGLVVFAGEDTNWKDYKLSIETFRNLLESSKQTNPQFP